MNIELDEGTVKRASRFFLGEDLTDHHIRRLLLLAERCVYFEWRLKLLPDRLPDWKDRLDEIAQRAGVPEPSHEHRAYLASLDGVPN